MGFSELHRENLPRIESDYANLYAAYEMATETIQEEGEKDLCFPALIPVLRQAIDHLAEVNEVVAQDLVLRIATPEGAAHVIGRELARELLRMYYMGIEMGKRNHTLWSHVIDTETYDKAEEILHRSWPT